MQQKKFLNKYRSISNYIDEISKNVGKNATDFGYRERIQIERCLFILLKFICKEKLKYNIQGFSNNHIKKLRNYSEKIKCDGKFLQIFEKIFQLKIFLMQISSENAYVRGDSITKLGLNERSIFNFIEVQLNSISAKVNSLMKYN